jgi:hypothetical protein
MMGHSETFNGLALHGVDALLNSAQVALGEEAWAATLVAGRALSPEQAIAVALGEESRDA